MDENEFARMQQLEAMKKQLLGKILTKEAYERLARVRIANPETASQVELYLIQLFQAGKISTVGDSQLREVLVALTEKREFKIKRE